MKYHLIGALWLAAAAALESAGLAGGSLLLLAGVACEVSFWVRRSARRRHPQGAA
jgi:Na+/serine symporter